MRYKFRAKDLKTGKVVEGDLAYVYVSKRIGMRPMIVAHGIHGGFMWVGARHPVDEKTIEIVKE